MTTPREWWLDDRRLHLLAWGSPDAPAVLLVHGITGNAWNWEPFAERVATRHQLVALDMRGHGESAHAEGETYEHLDYLADVLTVIEHVGPPVPIVGHSIGGHVCLILAALRTDLVSSLVLVDIEAFPPRTQPDTLRRLGANPHPVFPDLAAVVEELRSRLPAVPEAVLCAKAEHDTVLQRDGTRMYRFDRGVLRRVTAPDARPYLPRVRCPVLLVRGDQSHVMRETAAAEMAATFQQSSTVEIPNSTHWPHLENVERFSQAVQRFLESRVGE